MTLGCFDIEHNLSLHYINNKLTVGPCCQAQHYELVKNTSVAQHPRLIEIRDLNKQNILTSDCQSCVIQEEAGGLSRRVAQREFYKNWNGSGIRSLDLHMGNLCNLKCVICSADNSTAWITDAKLLGKDTSDVEFDKKNQVDVNWIAGQKNLEMVHFWGGEPLMVPEQILFLQEMHKHNVLSNCRLTYNTNATIIPNKQLLNLWGKSKLVELYFSIDDINDRFEYQRTNAKWANIKQNLQWFYTIPIDNHLFYFTVTWSMLNIYYLPELFDWIRNNLKTNRHGDETQIHLNPGKGPCAVTQLDSRTFKILEKKYKNYPELNFILNSIDITDSADYTRFFEYTKKIDRIRNNDYKLIHPEWANIIGF